MGMWPRSKPPIGKKETINKGILNDQEKIAHFKFTQLVIFSGLVIFILQGTQPAQEEKNAKFIPHHEQCVSSAQHSDLVSHSLEAR